MTPDEEIEALRARNADLEAALNQNNLDIAVTFGLTPASANVLGLLLALPMATPEAIQHRLELVADSKVAVCRLRSALKPMHKKLGIPDDTKIINNKYQMGYWIEPEMKKVILDALNARFPRTQDPGETI